MLAPDPATAGQPMTFTDTVAIGSPTGTTPTGIMTFYLGDDALGTGALDAADVISLETDLRPFWNPHDICTSVQRVAQCALRRASDSRSSAVISCCTYLRPRNFVHSRKDSTFYKREIEPGWAICL